MKKVGLLFIILCLPALLTAQNFQYIPLQASFENESFFYHPLQLTSSNIGPFSEIMPGFRSVDAMNQLAQNPAWLPDLSGHDLYVYVNVQSRNTYKAYAGNNYYNPCTLCMYSISPQAPYPNSSKNADGRRLNQKPFFSVAFLGFPFTNKHIFAGFTYQGIKSRQDYYAFPSSLYPQVTTYNDIASTTINSTEFSPKSSMKQTSSFVSLHVGYRFSDKATVGLRIGSAFFRRDGGYGNKIYPYTQYPEHYNIYLPFSASELGDLIKQQRTQHYQHLTVDLGGRYIISDQITGMAHVGYLSGNGDEGQNISSPLSYSETGMPYSGNDYSLNESATMSLNHWINHGHSFTGGFSLQYNLPNNSLLQFFYEGFANHEGLKTEARTMTASYTNQQFTGNLIKQFSSISESSGLYSGNGSTNIWTNQLGLFYNWSPFSSLTLDFGIQYDHYKRSIYSRESGDITGFTLSFRTDTTGSTINTHRPSNSAQQLDWNNHLRKHSFQIPLIARVHLGSRFEIWGGFYEQIESIRDKDNLLNPDPNSVYYPLPNYNYTSKAFNSYRKNTIGDSEYYMTYHYTRYRFTLLAGLNFDVTNRLTLRLSALPFDHRYSYERTQQTSGLIWQTGLSYYL